MRFRSLKREKSRPRNGASPREGNRASNKDQSRILQPILDCIGAGVTVIDTEGNFLHFNKEGADIIGLGATDVKIEEWQGKYGVFLPDEETPFPVEEMFEAQVMKGEAFDRVEMFIRNPKRPEGIHIMVTGRPLRDASGTLTGAVNTFVDITQHKRTDQELQKLSNVVVQTADSVVITDKEGVIEYVNPAFTAVTGYTEDEVLGKTSRILKSDRQDDSFYQKLWSTILSGEVFQSLITNRRKDGTLYHEQKTITPLLDAEGKITHFVATGKDVTESKEAEEFMRRQAGILEATSDFVGFAAPDGTVRYVNYAGREMCGLGRGFDVTTMKLSDMLPKWVNQLLTEQAFPTANRIGIWKGEAAFLHIDGHEIPVSMVLLAHRSEDGRVRYYSTISRDITELKWAKKKQQESEARRHDFFEASPLAIMEGDLSQVRVAFEELRAEGITDLREHLKTHPEFLPELVSRVEILDVNQAAVRLIGAGNRDEVLVGLPRIFVPETMKAFEEIMITLWEGGTHYEGETLFSTHQGVLTHILLTLTVTGNPPDVKTVVVTMTDISDLKRTEDELSRKAQELARSNKDLEEFAHVTSHDLKEPLRTISSYLQLLEERYREKLDADADTFIAFAVEGAKRMQRQITDLLEYSRVGGTSPDAQLVNCETVLHQAVANLEVAIQETGAEITHGDFPDVLGDQTQLIQLFQNLIGNAIKFRGPDSPKVHISAEETDSEWKFAVKDNGLGIDPQHAEQIFTIFQRLHTRDAYPGTGIGLAICKRIVEGFGGRIWVDSEPDTGSTFYFTLPRGVRNET